MTCYNSILQQQSAMNDLVKEKNQLEQEMREIYDKRESVAQWEAQISEIIKWWVTSDRASLE